MPVTIESKSKTARQKQSWMIAVLFAALGTGFILFWMTLDILTAGILSAIISLAVWPLSRSKGGKDFASKAVALFFVAAIIGVLVGLGSSAGTGLPVSGP